MRTISILLALAALASSGASQTREVIAPKGSSSNLPFSPAISCGDFVYLSGTIPTPPAEGAPSLSIEDQTRQTFKKIQAVLGAAGLDLSDVVCSNVFLTDSRRFRAMNAVYAEYFDEVPPTRATVQADLALPGIDIEITFVAAKRGVKKKAIVPQGWQKPTRPYSWGIQAGDTLFVSGMVSRNCRTGDLVLGTAKTQTRQVLDNVGEVLRAAGLDFSDVVSSRVYLTDARDFQAMNEVYRGYFKQDPPARATVRTPLMNPDLRVEIQCIAVRDPNRAVIIAEGARPSSNPFSASIRAGGRQFLAGMVGRGPDGFAPGDVVEQTRQTLRNLKATLEAAGGGFEDVLESTVILSDARYFSLFNETYKEMFPDAPPTRTTIGAQLMSPDLLVEIMMTARCERREN